MSPTQRSSSLRASTAPTAAPSPAGQAHSDTLASALLRKARVDAARAETVERGRLLESGWIHDTRTWTYASATSFTRTGASTLWGKGVYFKYKQGGVQKFGACFGVSTDTVSITGGTDYTVANAAITDTYYSLMRPADFPDSFAFTPAFVAAGATFAYTSRSGRFSIHGQRLRVWAYLLLNGAPGGTTTGAVTVRLPVASANLSLGYSILLAFPQKVAFTTGYTGFHAFLNPNTTDANLCTYGSGQVLYSIPASALASGASVTVEGEYLI